MNAREAGELLDAAKVNVETIYRYRFERDSGPIVASGTARSGRIRVERVTVTQSIGEDAAILVRVHGTAVKADGTRYEQRVRDYATPDVGAAFAEAWNAGHGGMGGAS